MKSTILLVSALFIAMLALWGCDDGSTPITTNNNVFVPSDGGAAPPSDAGSDPDTGTVDGGGCTNKPAGCFCGTPTTHQQFLNRCTSSAAIPFTTAFTAATAQDLP